MTAHPCAASRLPLKGATLADRPSRIGGVLGSDILLRQEFVDSRSAASRNLLKGATLADRPSRIGGVLVGGIARRMAAWKSLSAKALGAGSGHLTGVLRVEAVSHRRTVKVAGRVGL
jgi:hypothetical protein